MSTLAMFSLSKNYSSKSLTKITDLLRFGFMTEATIFSNEFLDSFLNMCPGDKLGLFLFSILNPFIINISTKTKVT